MYRLLITVRNRAFLNENLKENWGQSLTLDKIFKGFESYQILQGKDYGVRLDYCEFGHLRCEFFSQFPIPFSLNEFMEFLKLLLSLSILPNHPQD